MVRSALLLPVFCAILNLCAAHARAAEPSTIPIQARPGSDTLLTTTACVIEPVNAPPGLVRVATVDKLREVHLSLPPERRDDLTVEVKVGSLGGDGGCVPGETLRFQVKVNSEPEISAASVQQALVVLMSAFVLALLLESAFELLFNWRLFQAYFVGRAWRTPIMFAISLVIVRRFHLDLLAEVFAAYHGGNVPASTWLSSALTAMILSGGSVGVNRILIALNFRPAVPKTQEEAKKPAPTEAYVSIEVRGLAKGQKIALEWTESDNTDNRPPIQAVMVGDAGSRLKQILFPSRTRFPSSGGATVIPLRKCYRFVLRDLGTGKLHDISGAEIGSVDLAKALCFAPRAVVDLVVVLGPREES